MSKKEINMVEVLEDVITGYAIELANLRIRVRSLEKEIEDFDKENNSEDLIERT